MNDRAAAVTQVEQPMRALLELVQTDRDRQCAAAEGEARARSAALLAQAHLEARTRMRNAFAEQRQRVAERLAAAQARLATLRRLHEQQRTAAMLRLAWEQLPAELARLWQQPAARAAWVAQVLASARTHLGDPAREPWRIVHAADWPQAEQQALATGFATALSFQADGAIAAGLKLTAHGNVIDGTLAGLLADRAEIEARLLHMLEPAA